MNIKRLIIAVFVLNTVLLTSCSSPKHENTLRLGYMPNVTHAPALVGIEKNIFQNELGRDIKFQPVYFLVGNSIIDAFITGQIDAAYVGPGPFINAIYRKIPVKLLANAANGGTLIVGEGAPLHLRSGDRIAVPQYGNTQDLILRGYLERNSLADKVKIIAIPPQDTGTAFFTMSIDAACLPEPWGTLLIKKNVCKLLVDEKEVLNNGNYPVTFLVISEKLEKGNPELIQKLLQAHKKSIIFLQNNSEESVDVIVEAITKISKKNIDRDVISTSFKKCIFNDKVDFNLLKDFVQIGIKAGYYKEEFLNRFDSLSIIKP